MKKKLIPIFLIVLISVILICGCAQQESGIKVIKINELVEKAEVDKPIIVQGRWFQWGDLQQIMSDEGKLHVKVTEGVDTSNLSDNTQYYFRGILRYGPPPGYNTDMLYLEILEISTELK